MASKRDFKPLLDEGYGDLAWQFHEGNTTSSFSVTNPVRLHRIHFGNPTSSTATLRLFIDGNQFDRIGIPALTSVLIDFGGRGIRAESSIVLARIDETTGTTLGKGIYYRDI